MRGEGDTVWNIPVAVQARPVVKNGHGADTVPEPATTGQIDPPVVPELHMSASAHTCCVRQ